MLAFAHGFARVKNYILFELNFHRYCQKLHRDFLFIYIERKTFMERFLTIDAVVVLKFTFLNIKWSIFIIPISYISDLHTYMKNFAQMCRFSSKNYQIAILQTFPFLILEESYCKNNFDSVLFERSVQSVHFRTAWTGPAHAGVLMAAYCSHCRTLLDERKTFLIKIQNH